MMPELDDLLKAILSGEDEPAERAVLALAAYGDQAVSALAQRLPDVKVDGRWWAARALAAIFTPSSVELLKELLNDPSADVRRLCGRWLWASCAQPKEQKCWCSPGRREAHTWLKFGTISLAHVGEAAVPRCYALWQEGDTLVRTRAGKSLGPHRVARGDPRADPAHSTTRTPS